MYTWEEIENDKEAIAEKFKWLFFYEPDTIEPNTWMGRRIQKNPLDLFIYSEIAHEVKPRLVIETGSFWGGSAVWWADIMKLIHGDESGKVISIDPNALDTDTSGRNIEFINGSSIDSGIFNRVLSKAQHGPILVNLDSLHDEEHVFNEMILYSQLVTVDSYMIVEDGIINGHPTHPEYGPGPYEACERFLALHSGFKVDRSRERMMVTANPMGFLKRIR